MQGHIFVALPADKQRLLGKRGTKRFDYFGFRATILLALHGPGAARMQHVPRRSLLLIPTGSRIVVAEPVKHCIPDGREPSDKQGFTEWNPNIINDKITTCEVR
jgi:hypothetical protein